jgi:hypothetical protein
MATEAQREDKEMEPRMNGFGKLTTGADEHRLELY